METLRFAYHFIDRHLGCSHFLVIMNNVTMNTCTQVLCGCMLSIYPGILAVHLGMELLAHIITL